MVDIYRYFTGIYHFFGSFPEWYGIPKSGMVFEVFGFPAPGSFGSLTVVRTSASRGLVLRVCAPSSALSIAPVHAARGDVRLVGRGGGGEVRGRDACATGWRGEARDISAFTCAYLGTPLGSGRDLGRFGHV